MAVEKLNHSRKPLIYFGGGSADLRRGGGAAGAGGKAGYSGVRLHDGSGRLSARHRLWLGMVGMHGTLAANRAARECDVLLVCGARFSDGWRGAAPALRPTPR